ncbi:MAG: arginine-tRNA-protein transferase [Candidatus Adlerbacteria bacterium]|nr:arginine-tRNA-protein transferase [Candidatus Adlerbacteria bacterium]
MRMFSSEFAHDYGSYTFAYGNYCERESGDTIAAIYRSGYLPYSGSQGVKNIFYMARSARVALTDFTLSSENRRISKKFDGQFHKQRIVFADFNVDESFISFCLAYFADKHGSVMPRERLQDIMTAGIITHIVEYKKDERIVAYVLEARDGNIAHYWYSFYDLAYTQQSLGLWLMLDCVRDAHQDGLAYYYLGTVYGEKALYKTSFEPLEWWDGESWNTGIAVLKDRSRSDSERSVERIDCWKKGHELY